MGSGFWIDLAATLGVPVVVWITATGVGLLVESATRVRLPNALSAPLGFGAIVSLLLGVYSLGFGNGLALPVLIALVVAGLALHRRELPARLNPGWPAVAAIGAYVLFSASVLATGHWTFTGYNQVDDPAFEFLMIQHMQGFGLHLGHMAPSNAANFLHGYLSVGYPLGAQSYLAAICGLLHTSVAVLWQGFLSSMLALGAMAASTLTGRVLDRRLAALAGLLTVTAALTFQYALLGSIKEVGVLMALLSASAVIRHAILALRGPGAAAVSAISVAALLSTYGSAGLPYALALVGSALLSVVLVHRRWPTRAWLGPGLVGAVTVLVFSLPAVSTLPTSVRVVTRGFTGAHPVAPPLGPLFRPLPLSEVSGVWLYGDYRLKVPGGAAGTLTALATGVLFALMIAGTIRLLRRREPGPLMMVITVGLVLLIVMPRVTPYAKAKLLAIGSPSVILAASAGLAVRRRRFAVPAALVGSGLIVTVLGSDALAYHNLPVAPTDRLAAISQIGRRVGDRGPVLYSEFEQYAKYFGLPAWFNVATDVGAPAPIRLTSPLPKWDHSFDLDQEPLAYVESFPYLVTRRSPAASHPPANFRLLFQNSYYQLWQREKTPQVLKHLGLQGLLSGGAPVPCQRLRTLVAHAPASSELLLSPAARSFGFALAAAPARPRGWKFAPPDSVVPYIPGRASETVSIPGGNYRLWARGDFPRRVQVQLDGHTIGSIAGSNAPDSWLASDRPPVQVVAGNHTLSLVRPGAGPAPGDGLRGLYSAVALVDAPPGSLTSAPVRRWRQLCARTEDWVELVRP